MPQIIAGFSGRLAASQALQWGTDLFLVRDAANTLALRNGVSAQALSVYNTFTDASNYERGGFDWSTNANTLTIGTAKAGTGISRALQIVIGSSNVMQWSTAGHMLWNTDNLFDIGASGASRPRNYFGAGYVQTGLTTIASLPAASTALKGARYMVSDSSVAASGNFGANVTGTGANVVPVFCDGVNWKIG